MSVPGTTVHHLALTRLAISTARRTSANTLSRIPLSPDVQVGFLKSAVATNTPISMPSRDISLAIASCVSTDRLGILLSSTAVNPLSAMNFSWSIKSLPAL